MQRKRPMTILLALLILVFPAHAAAKERLIVGHFSAAAPGEMLPEGWEPLTFSGIKRHTAYKLVLQDDIRVIRADSRNSASGLIRKIRIDPARYPIIKWRWKTAGIYQKGDVSRKDGDDYPARIYIAFEYRPEKVGIFDRAKFGAIKFLYGEYPPTAAINYIWESKAPVGTIVPNPYTDRVRMIVVETGRQHLGVWREESRNIREDYITAFGEEPPLITGVGIMTDSDDTGESAISCYGDIVFESE